MSSGQIISVQRSISKALGLFAQTVLLHVCNSASKNGGFCPHTFMPDFIHIFSFLLFFWYTQAGEDLQSTLAFGSFKWSMIGFLKGSYNAFLKIIVLCIWCNSICWHALLLKKHNFSNTVHYCSSSMPRLSGWHSALWLAEHRKHASEMKCPLQ